jgi:branched-chain amino acid transport system permease protein
MTISPSTTSPDRRHIRLVGLLPWLFAGAVVGYAMLVVGYAATVVSFALICAVFVTGLNLFMGFAAQVSFGQNAFAAIGGYISAVLTATHGWSPLPAMALGMAAAVLAAAIIGFPALRLKGHYLAMGTLAIGLIAYEITVEWQSVTQGYMGISGVPPMGVAGYEVTSDRGQLVMLALVVAAGAFAASRIRRSRFGRALSAVAGSEEAAQALGIDVARYKLMAFLLSAGFAALAGSLLVHVVGFVSPEVFGLHMVIVTFTMLYVGGIGTVAGPLIGALIVSLLPETFRAFKDYQDLAYGAALILLLIYAPRGLGGSSSGRCGTARPRCS